MKLLLASTKNEGRLALIHLGKDITKANFETLEGISLFLANVIVDANALYLKRTRLSTSEQKHFDDALSPLQQWLLQGLPQLSKKTPFINTLASLGTSVLDTKFGQWIGGTIGSSLVKNVVNNIIDESPLTDEQKKSWKENKQLMKGIDKLVNALIPIIPKIKEKHDLDFYSQALEEINSLIQSPEPVDPQKVRVALSKIVNHFLDVDLSKYEEPILTALDKVAEIG